ncbi:hypothetical protein BDV26DRAFT_280731 [Aspergillus bertholletiae]|uniref:BTB domain-containing protein n=1 Tax=Aspergillus bertholletiae TaxID=1226010 RepID=A0A5N7BAP1_9EURO|nr:hypothetical protein BDV26DRAFT_280731 [Aspergillus bertholletiae]
MSSIVTHPFAPWRDYEETSTDEASTEETSVGEAPIAKTSAEEIPVKEIKEPMETQYFRLQVSARHLILASPVFKAALSENWKKRADPLKNGAVEITTSGWDLEALVILMTILHARSQDLPQEIGLELLAKLAVLADYYQCQPFVQYFAEKWIEALKVNFPSKYSRDSILWVWVSWTFNQSTEFTKSTSIAILQSNGIITNLGLPIPGKIIGMLRLQV